MINRVLLGNKFFVSIGLISYPLYLWHWPILTFARIGSSAPPTTTVIVNLLILSVLLSWFTHRFVEAPLRFGGNAASKALILIGTNVVVGIISYSIFIKGGIPSRVADSANFLSYFENDRPEMNYFKKIDLEKLWHLECAYFDHEKYKQGLLKGSVADSKPIAQISKSCYSRDNHFEKSLLIWGDSHAQALSPGIRKHIPSNWQVLQIATSGCLPNSDISSPSAMSQCDQSNYMAMATIRSVIPDVVIVAQSFGHSAQNSKVLAKKLKSLGVKKVLIVGPVVKWSGELPTLMARQLWLKKPQRTHIGLDQKSMAATNHFKTELLEDKNLSYIDVVSIFCNDDGCLTYFGDDPKTGITTFDYGHLTPVASDYLAEKLLTKKIVEE